MIPLPVSPIQTADLTKSKGYILNYDDYTYYQYDYDGAGFQLHIDFEKIAQELDCAVKYYVILSYDFKYFAGDWLLKGIAGSAKKHWNNMFIRVIYVQEELFLTVRI